MRSMGALAKGERLERLTQSPLWDGSRLRNVHPIIPGLRDPGAARPTLKDFFCSDLGRRPGAPLPSVDPRGAWQKPSTSGLRATWLGHSTVLIEIDGYRILTDPVWGNRASPLSMVGPKRFQPVPVRLRDLSTVDAVVISHDHYDHLDYPTIKALAKSDVPFVTSLGVGAHLQAWGIDTERIFELDWWESHRITETGLTITAAPSQHFSGRGLKDRNLTLWSSMVLQGDTHRVFFSGDTGLTCEYERIQERLGPFDLVMLEVGAFHPSWGDIHLGPANALKAHQYLGGGVLLPIHWGTFSLAMHPWDEPVETLLTLADPDHSHLLLPRLGQPVEPSQRRPVETWWREIASKNSGQPAEVSSESHKLQGKLPWPLD